MKKRKPISDWAENCLDVIAVAMIGLTFLMVIPLMLKVIVIAWSSLFSYLGF